MVKSSEIAEIAQGCQPRPLRIFLVENDKYTAEYLRLYLERIGHRVIVRVNFESALEAFPESGCNVLISDISLPDGNGWDLMAKLKEGCQFDAIAMSGYAEIQDIKRSKAVGFMHHLTKPFTPELLESVLQEISEK